MPGFGYGRGHWRGQRRRRAASFPTYLGYDANGPRISLGGAATAYPPTLSVQLPFAVQTVGDAFRIVAASDLSFATIVANVSITLTGNAATDAAAVNAALAAIASPAVTYIRCYCGGWSNVVQHGMAAAPTVTAGATATNVETTVLNHTITTSVPCYLELAGDDGDCFELATPQPAMSFNLRWVNDQPESYDWPQDFNRDYVFSFDLIATGLNGAQSTTAATVTLLDLDTVPDALNFTNVTGATEGTSIESNVLTVTGLAAGYSAPLSINTLWRKNDGSGWTAYQSGPTTAKNGDQLQIKKDASGAFSTQVSTTVDFNGVVTTWLITTRNDPNQATIASAGRVARTGLGYAGAQQTQTMTFNAVVGKMLFAVESSNPVSWLRVDGVDATLVTTLSLGTAALNLYEINVTTTGPVTVTVRGATSWDYVIVLAYTSTNLGAVSQTGTLPQAYNRTTVTASAPLTIPANGVGIGFVWSTSTAATFTNGVVLDNDVTRSGVFAGAAAHYVTATPSATRPSAGWSAMLLAAFNKV